MDRRFKEEPVIQETTSRRVTVTVGEFATSMGIGRTLAYRLVLSGEVSSVKLGRSRRIPVWAIEAYVAKLVSEQGTDNAGR